ncbi:MAG: hypothetical protein DBY14_05270 [Escherichia coli]|nr:MAG: hypothetical protein DBY14_05270 [Escherichia coli]
MKNISKIVVSAVAVTGILGTVLGVHFGYAKKTDDFKNYTVETNGQPLKVGIISDLQLPNTTKKSTHQYKSFEKTLAAMKSRNMDALIIAGDFTDLSAKSAWNTFKEIYDNVMADAKKPIPLYIMGNHDYWLDTFSKAKEIPTPAKQQRRFTKYTGEYPYSHKTINGYHFIGWSSSNGSYDESYKKEKWIRQELDKAVKDDPTKPIFIITHLKPSDTVYGSDKWGNDDIQRILKDYSQVISISGHSHYSILDERSIWQGDFTAFTTQSLDYIELETGKFNGSIPKDAYGNTMAEQLPASLFMNIENDKITVERLNANTGDAIKEPWVIEAPFDKPKKYTNDRMSINQAPVLDENINVSISKITDINKKEQKIIAFKAGNDDNFVHSYKIQFKDKNKNTLKFTETDYDGNINHYDENGEKITDNKNHKYVNTKEIEELLYFSDFTLGLDNMSETVKLRLPSTMPKETEYIAITAIDSWDAESKAVLCKIKQRKKI